MALNEQILKAKLLDDMKESLKTKDSVRKDVIQIVRAGVLQIEKDKQTEVDDTVVLEVIVKEIKKRNEVLPDYEKAGRTEMVTSIHRQIELLEGYLPKQLSEQEVIEIVEGAILSTNATSMKDMGKVMAVVSPLVSGKADTKAVSELVKKALNK